MSLSYKIYHRTDVNRKSGLFPVYLRVIINRKKKEYFLNVEIPVKLWNKEQKKVKRSLEYPYEDMNVIIGIAQSKANKIIRDARFSDSSLTLGEFDRLFKRKTLSSNSFYDYATNYMEENKHKYAAETYRTYSSQITKMKQFRPELSLADLDETFLLQYERHMFNTLKNKTNTHYKSMGFIKTVYKQALDEGLVKEGIFKRFPLTKKDGNRDFLTISELNKLEALPDSKLTKYLQNARRYFLFACYTGLRYTDMKNLCFHHILGGEMIQIEMHKTKETVTIPLISKAKKLIGEGFSHQKIFRVASNQVANRYIKEIMSIAEIPKNISFHGARHTFATCSIDLGMRIEVISKVLGHKKLATTQIYAKIMDSVKVREMGKWDAQT